MAGAGKKTFTAGETLTASDVNNYLGDQAVMYFGGTAARSSAIPTPTVGMTSYRGDTKQIESYDGAVWRGMSGLQLVKSQAIGTGVSSVSVTDAFSSTYENYKIIMTGGVGSANTDVRFSLNGITSGYYSAMAYISFGSTSVAGISQSNTAFIQWTGYIGTANAYMECTVHNPNLAKPKQVFGNFAQETPTGAAGSVNAWIDSTTQATAFTIAPQTGTLTGGTIYVYGYAK